MEAKFKIAIVGKSGVGKSSVLSAFVNEYFDLQMDPTVGVDFKTKEMYVKGDKIKLGLWDTAGMERFRVVTPTLYRGVHGVILVYDVTDRSSLNDLYSWISELYTYTDKQNFVGLVLGNKIDMPRVVSTEEGVEFARKHRMLFLESSAKTKEGVKNAFEELAYKIHDTIGLWEYDKTGTIPQQQPNMSSNCYCLG